MIEFATCLDNNTAADAGRPWARIVDAGPH